MASNVIIRVTFLLIMVLTADGTPSPPPNGKKICSNSPDFISYVVAGNVVQCFASTDCSGSPSSITATAKQCSIGSDDSLSYMTPDGCKKCIGETSMMHRYEVNSQICFSSWF